MIHRHSGSFLFILWVLCGSNMVKSFKIITTELHFFIYQKPKANIPLKSAVGTRKRANGETSLNLSVLWEGGDVGGALQRNLDASN